MGPQSGSPQNTQVLYGSSSKSTHEINMREMGKVSNPWGEYKLEHMGAKPGPRDFLQLGAGWHKAELCQIAQIPENIFVKIYISASILQINIWFHISIFMKIYFKFFGRDICVWPPWQQDQLSIGKSETSAQNENMAAKTWEIVENMRNRWKHEQICDKKMITWREL